MNWDHSQTSVLCVQSVVCLHCTLHNDGGVSVCLCVSVCVPGSQQLMSPRLSFPIPNHLGSVQLLRNLESKIKMFTKYF